MATNREQKQNNGNNRNKSSKESKNNNERNKNESEKKCRTIVVVKNQNCGFCVRKLESTTGEASYSHLPVDRYIFISIQTNVAQIYVPYLERSFAQKVV
jgi:hypothetical protein